ncbi:PTS system, N-acetylglucosamine-specific IIBC subunit [Elusimicrobium minutum Pei191]|uniref:PTS system, N-acetylglucosamine-specific IIBC subunit n=1 Tax=Elusimicrobium minutum (strain Pei191) TaxID=445932 RepID=B2KEF3_ELUMP|nr:N-acetylglucosamine-specific PTS transporter subunit IIBC [Elusimicrobium minutum]ACC98899.1 PTS system, N-acetylglucosamine-specific IIBC subunit [Elusimicrobium minutum Pei191]
MKKYFSAVTKAFVTLGKALMLPIAVLPIAGLLLRLGQPDLLNIAFLADSGDAIFKNLPTIFALGVSIGFAKDNHGAAPLSAYVGYVVLTAGLKVLNPETNMGVFGGIIIGVMAGYFYNRFHDIQLPSYLAFFGGKRFVPIITGTSAVFLALAASVIWPPVEHAINSLGTWIIGSKGVGLFIFGFANRLLIPLGLHHVLNNLVWFLFGNFEVVKEGAVVLYQGDIARFFAGDPAAGSFMAGFFPVMMFGLPAACFAMMLTAKTAKRKATAGILLSMALTSFLTGITEPIEFSFMFLAFPLYVLHALLTGISMVVMDLMNIKLGFTFSAGAFDFVLNWGKATNPARFFIVGGVYAVLYFVVFYFAIKFWDLKTPGREDDVVESEETCEPGQNSKAVEAAPTSAPARDTRGYKYMTALGGKENLKVVDACATRLRLEVVDSSKVKDVDLKALGARGVLRPGDGLVQVIIGPEADLIAGEIRKEF